MPPTPHVRSRGIRATTAIVVAACLLGLAAPAIAAAQSYDPAYRFQTINTTHFAIHFHPSERAEAEFLQTDAERTWQALAEALRVPPPLHTDVILVDQTEDANGWATPTPRPTVMITAAWPAGVEFIGATTDWIALVFTHEFTHIVHLDQSRAWAATVRHVFGRVPLAFPNTLLPAWQVEGLAVLEESALTGMGRQYAGDFRAITNAAARAGRLEPFDRVNGGLTSWPAGNAVYAYGLGFSEYLAQRFGAVRIGELMTSTAGQLPYLWPRAFTQVFGQPVGTLWRDYQTSLAASFTSPDARARSALADADTAVRLTHHGFVVEAPRMAPAMCAVCPEQIIYTSETPDGFPGMYALSVDGSAPPARLTSRNSGSGIGAASSTLYFDQQDRRRNAGLYSDVYAFDRARRTTRRLSRGLRLSDPDVSPDERSLVAVRGAAGRRELVRVALHGGTIGAADLSVLATETGGQFNAPRFSPDGKQVVVERHRPGHMPEIVVVDVATKVARLIAGAPGTRYVTPVWRPDGQAIIAATAERDAVFNLVEIGLLDGTSRSLTHTIAGATWPEVTRDGRWLIFVGYTPDGYDLFRMPYRTSGPPSLTTRADPRDEPRAEVPPPDVVHSPTHAYTPWRTLAPTFWTPTLDSSNGALRVGALVTGSDVLNYHAYAASASWLTAQPADTAQVRAPDVSFAYTYARWTMQPWVAASTKTTFVGLAPDEAGLAVTATVRERTFEAGLFAPTLGVRRSRAVGLSFIRNVADVDAGGITGRRNRSAMRASFTAASAHTFGYSISPEGGGLVGATVEIVRRGFGADANGIVWTGDARAYLRGAARHHVVALRAAAGGASGDVDAARIFLLGGAASAPGPASFDSEALSLLRGFAPDTFAGRHVVLLNADYRLPLWRPERGINTWPIFLRTVHASVFGDAAQAWSRSRMASAWTLDAGAELSADVVLGYGLPLTITSGAAFGHDRGGRVDDGWRAYVRVGRAF